MKLESLKSRKFNELEKSELNLIKGGKVAFGGSMTLGLTGIIGGGTQQDPDEWDPEIIFD